MSAKGSAIVLACLLALSVAGAALSQEEPHNVIPDDIPRTGPVTVEVSRDSQFTPADFRRMQPFFELKPDGYGPLDPNYRPRYCDGTTAFANDMTDRLFGGLLSGGSRTLNDINNPEVDPAIVNADLQGNFPTLYSYFPGAPANIPLGRGLVAILERKPNSITFWHATSLVRESEIEAAAQEYCRRSNRGAVFAGGAQACEDTTRDITYRDPTRPIMGTRTYRRLRSAGTVNGQAVNMISTYIISQFRCEGAPAPQERR